MRIETLENRTMLTVGAFTSEFNFDSDNISSAEVAALNSGDLRFSELNEWYKPVVNNFAEFNAAGQLVARRTRQDTDLHTMFVARVRDSECFGVDGLYTLPGNHYKYSFDIRFPETESGWLSDHNWAVVSQLWGPRENGEVPLNPPFSIHTTSIDGKPHWAVSIRADSRRLSDTKDYDHEETFRVPFTGRVGDWHTWDVELVIDPFGDGLMRSWLNGELVAEQVGVPTGYHAFISGEESGPLNPAFGLYAPLVGNKMEAHFDNIQISCSSNFARSIAGDIDSRGSALAVVAVNRSTGQRFQTEASSAGVYALNVPAGSYDVTARDLVYGTRASTRVNVSSSSVIANIDLRSVQPSTQTPTQPNESADVCYESDGTRYFGGDCADLSEPDPVPQPEPAPEPQPQPKPEPQPQPQPKPEPQPQPDPVESGCFVDNGTRRARGGCDTDGDESTQPDPATPVVVEVPDSPDVTAPDECYESDGTLNFSGGCAETEDSQPDEDDDLPEGEFWTSSRVRRRVSTPVAALAVHAVFADSDENWLDN